MDKALRRVIGGLQIACFLFVHGVGSAFSIEIEHAHHGDAHHDHDLAGYHVAVSGEVESHHHDHSPFPSHQDEQQEDDPNPTDSAPSSHGHLLCFNVAPAMPVSGIVDFSPKFGLIEGFLRSEKEPCPDGPFFEVIKPPQLV